MPGIGGVLPQRDASAASRHHGLCYGGRRVLPATTGEHTLSLAFVFPGQGSQSVGMLAGLAARYSEVTQTFDEASAVLGYDLWTLVSSGPEERLNQTEQTQPAMLAAGIATWRVWRTVGGATPELLAGHSLGEYSALVCAGSLDYSTAVRLVAARGRFMQEAVPVGQGAIAAILGLHDDAVRAACEAGSARRPGEIAAAVNFNAPGQVVVAGHAGAVEATMASAQAMGARRAVRLPMSVPVHCELMRPATERLAALLAQVEVRPARIPVVNNADVAVREKPEEIRKALERQLYSPVRWADTIRALTELGVTRVIECGPGKVLTGLMKRIDRNLAAMALHDADGIEAALQATRGE